MSIGISGCTSCQLGGEDALKAYDRAFIAKKTDESQAKMHALIAQNAQRHQQTDINQPVIGASIGSQINISV